MQEIKTGTAKTPSKHKQPLAYYAFWLLLGAIVFLILWCCYQNIIPYEIVVRRIFKIQSNPIGVFNILGQRFTLTMAWLVAFVFWGVLQGLQVGYIVLTLSEKSMKFMLSKILSRQHYGVEKKDSNGLKIVKRSYNESPLAVLNFLSFGRLVAYGIEIVINFNAYPLWDGGLFGFFMALVDWSRFRIENAVLLLITLVAVEYSVFAAIMVYRLIEIFKESKAYSKPAQS